MTFILCFDHINCHYSSSEPESDEEDGFVLWSYITVTRVNVNEKLIAILQTSKIA